MSPLKKKKKSSTKKGGKIDDADDGNGNSDDEEETRTEPNLDELKAALSSRLLGTQHKIKAISEILSSPFTPLVLSMMGYRLRVI